MTFRTALLATALLPAALLAAAPAGAFEISGTGLTVGVTPTIASDYLFRGISQTRSRPAYQLTLDIAHESGVYVGAFASNVRFPNSGARQEIDLLGGYRREIAGVSFDLGAIYYTYPGSRTPGTPELSFFEVALKASYQIGPVKALASFNYSPNYFSRSGDGFYVEGGADITLPFEITGGLRIAHQWIERNSRFGTPDYTWFSVGLAREVYAGFTLAAGYYGTDIRRGECAPVVQSPLGQRVCDNRFLVSLSRAF